MLPSISSILNYTSYEPLRSWLTDRNPEVRQNAANVIEARNLLYVGVALLAIAAVGSAFSSHFIFTGMKVTSAVCLVLGIPKFIYCIPFLLNKYTRSQDQNPLGK